MHLSAFRCFKDIILEGISVEHSHGLDFIWNWSFCLVLCVCVCLFCVVTVLYFVYFFCLVFFSAVAIFVTFQLQYYLTCSHCCSSCFVPVSYIDCKLWNISDKLVCFRSVNSFRNVCNSLMPLVELSTIDMNALLLHLSSFTLELFGPSVQQHPHYHIMNVATPPPPTFLLLLLLLTQTFCCSSPIKIPYVFFLYCFILSIIFLFFLMQQKYIV